MCTPLSLPHTLPANVNIPSVPPLLVGRDVQNGSIIALSRFLATRVFQLTGRQLVPTPDSLFFFWTCRIRLEAAVLDLDV